MMRSFVNVPDLLAAGHNGSPSVPVHLKHAVVAIGNFDGVHRGHQAVLQTACNLAASGDEGAFAAAMTFEPHPRTIFNPQAPVFRLTPLPVKERLMQALGLGGLFVVPFSKDFSAMPASAFVDDILVDRLDVAHVVIGYDFHFGKGREGTPEFLMASGKAHGFGVTVVPAQRDATGAVVYSSSETRRLLADGEIAKANTILGYRYSVTGEIIHGEKRGRDLGYPTANMALQPQSELRHGIYAVRMRIDGALHDGVASFGRRPTFDNGAPLLETFVFDYSGDLYGKTVDVVFEKFLRGEEKFDSIEALIAQMDRDSANARKALAESAPLTAIDEALR
ncbi:MAG: bifunctional riboflavin kinase/FAD synthetase [Pseudomonadota bacterium]